MNNDINSDVSIAADFLGPDGTLVYNKLERALEITLHGMIFNSNHMSGMTLATKIQRALDQGRQTHSVTMEMVNEIRFYCCAGGYGGLFSVAQVLANRLGKPVRAYTTRYSPAGSRGGYSNKTKVFSSKSKNVMVEGIHRVLYFTSENIILPAQRAFR